MRVLAVQVDQPLTQVFQVRQCRRPAVDPRPASPLRIEDPAQQHFVSVAGELLLGQPRVDRRCVGGVEDRGEFGALGARAQLAQLEAVAQQQRQRIEEDRFSGAGFAREDGQAAVELDVERGNDDEIANREKAQHRGLARGGNAPHGALSLLRTAARSSFLVAPIRSGVALQCSFSRSIAK